MPSEITQDRMEKALHYLAQTDVEYATERAELERTEILRKRVRARAMLESGGSSVAERQARAEGHPDVQAADDAYVETVTKLEKLKARRETAALLCDLWRSVNSARRQGT